MQVEWQIQEETDDQRADVPLPDNSPEDELSGKGSRRYARLSRWLFVLLLIASTAWGVRFVLQKQLEDISAAAQAEVLAIHDIVQKAEHNRDEALFGSMISPEYPNWGRVQKRLVRDGQRWERAYVGLPFVQSPERSAGEVTEIAFTSDWRMATVTLAIPYMQHFPDPQNAQANSTPVTLHQTVTYREEPTGWSLVPMYPAFWGETRRTTGQYLTVEYPERDAEIVERLVAEWDELLAAACQELNDLNCKSEWKLQIELSTQSSLLSVLADPIRWLDSEPMLKLPTPSIIGRPLDEAGYQALRASYAPLVISAGIADRVGWHCCQKAVFFRALLDKQLNKLGLIPWPLTPARYREILHGPLIDVTDLRRVYLQRSLNNISTQTRHIVYSLIDFILTTRPRQSLVDLQRSLVYAETYGSWLRRAGFNSYGIAIQREWSRYVNEQLLANAETGPQLDQDIQLLCTTEQFRNTDLYRYDTQSGTFTQEIANRPFRLMYPLAGDEGVLLQERLQPVTGFPLQLWRHRQAQEVIYRPDNGPLFPVNSMEHLRPDGSGATQSTDEMLLYTYDSRQRVLLFNSLNLEDCAKGTCAIQLLDGFPVWSPNRERTIINRGSDVLWLGNQDGQPDRAIARGSAVAWLDDDRFAFIQPEEQVNGADSTGSKILVKVMTLPQLESATILDVDTLLDALPLLPNDGANEDVRDVEQMAFSTLALHPTMPDQLFVATRVQRIGRTIGRTETAEFHIFAYTLSTGKISYLLQVDHSLEPFHPIRFSPDGRWLLIRSVERGGDNWYLNLYNTQSGESLVYASNLPLAFLGSGDDLSGNGEWLLRVENGFLHLVALNDGAQRLVVHDLANCYAAAWVNRNPNDE